MSIASEIRLSISVMHCSWSAYRVAMLRDIIERLGDLSSLVSFSICDDVNKNGVWWNCKQAWSKVHPESTHHIVLQDDMMPCKNFIQTLYAIIQMRPENIVHIFASNDAAIKALEEDKHWYTTPDGSWGGSIILPRKHFGWCEWSDEHFQDLERLYDDARMDFYAICNEQLIWSITPSLIEHVGYDKSLIRNAPLKYRMSRKYIGDSDPMDIDWSKGANNPFVGGITWGITHMRLKETLKDQYKDCYGGLDKVVSGVML